MGKCLCLLQLFGLACHCMCLWWVLPDIFYWSTQSSVLSFYRRSVLACVYSTQRQAWLSSSTPATWWKLSVLSLFCVCFPSAFFLHGGLKTCWSSKESKTFKNLLDKSQCDLSCKYCKENPVCFVLVKLTVTLILHIYVKILNFLPLA